MPKIKILIIDDNSVQADLLEQSASEFFYGENFEFSVFNEKPNELHVETVSQFSLLIIDQNLGGDIYGADIANDILKAGYSGSVIIYTGDITVSDSEVPPHERIKFAHKGDNLSLFSLIEQVLRGVTCQEL